MDKYQTGAKVLPEPMLTQIYDLIWRDRAKMSNWQ